MNYVDLPLKRNEKYTYLIISTNYVFLTSLFKPLFKRLCTSGAFYFFLQTIKWSNRL